MSEVRQRGAREQSWFGFVGTLVLFIVVIAASVALLTSLSPYAPSTQPEGFVAMIFVGTMAGEIAAFGLLAWLLRRRGLTLADIGMGRQTTSLAIASGVIVALLYAGVTVAGNPIVAANVFEPSWLKLLAIIATGLVAGVVEETIFRGYVMDTLARLGRGRVVQVLVSAVTYSLVHPSGPLALLFTFVLGAALAVVFLIGGRSLTPVILSHGLVNVIIEPGLFLSFAEFMG